MESLKFDEGYKEYMINDDPDRVIRINPSDLNMWQRCMDEMEKLGHVKDELQGNVKLLEDGTVDPTDENASAEWKKAEQGVKDCFNAIFNADVYDTLFNGQSPFSPVKGGKLLFESVMGGLMPIIKKNMKAGVEASNKRIQKYTAGYTK